MRLKHSIGTGCCSGGSVAVVQLQGGHWKPAGFVDASFSTEDSKNLVLFLIPGQDIPWTERGTVCEALC